MNNIKFAGKCEIFDVIPREDNYTRTRYVYMVMSFRGCTATKKNILQSFSIQVFSSSFFFNSILPSGCKSRTKTILGLRINLKYYAGVLKVLRISC